MGKKIRVWDGSAWQDVSVALPYNAVHSAQASMPSTAVDGQIWLDTDGTLSDTQYIPKTLTSTTGDIIYASSANTPARLGIGTSGQLLGVSGGVPAWTTFAGGGKVLQVVSSTSSTSNTTSSTSYIDTNLSASITPSASTSKILVLTFQPLHLQSNRQTYCYGSIKLVRGSTSISDQINSFGIECANGSRGVAGVWGWSSFAYLDSPNTTSSTTYKTQFLVDNATDTLAAQESGKPSSIILLEIGA